MRVGFCGLGIMGSRMAANLIRAGHEVTVWNRTASTAERWAADHRARVAATPRQAAAGADVAITVLVEGDHVERVLLGPDGAATAEAEGLLCVDMSTISSTRARRIAAALADRGARMVDAPVTGSAPKAEDGTLTIMAGGDAADVDRARPLFAAMGRTVVHAGPLGHGQAVKLINNAVAAANAATVAQALLAGRAAGVDLDALVQVMDAGSGGSAMLALKADAMRAHDYTPLFKLEHMLKDVRLCLEEAQAAGVPFPAAAAARDALVAALGRGHGADDFAAVVETFEGLAGIRL